MFSLMHQHLWLLLFPSFVCPACQTNRVSSRSACLCTSCQTKAYTFIAERKRRRPAVPAKDAVPCMASPQHNTDTVFDDVVE